MENSKEQRNLAESRAYSKHLRKIRAEFNQMKSLDKKPEGPQKPFRFALPKDE